MAKKKIAAEQQMEIPKEPALNEVVAEEDGPEIEDLGEDDLDKDDPDGEDPVESEIFSEKSGVPAIGKGTDLVRAGPLQQYLADIRKHPLISREEEYELAVRYTEEGDLKAAEKLVTSNLRLVIKIATEYQKYWMNLLDLIQEGNVGLMQAVKHYDPYRGVKLSSYSSFWIKAYILKFVIDNWSLVKVGTTQAQRKLFFNLKKEKEKYALLGYDPQPEDLARDLNVKPELVVEMDQRLAGGDFSLDQPVGNDTEDRHIDFLPTGDEDVDDTLAEMEIKKLFHESLVKFRSNLEDKDAYIFDHRLVAENPETLNEIGQKFGVSRERIRQIEERLVGKIRNFFNEEVPELADIAISLRD